MPQAEAQVGRREALIVAADHYEDSKLRALRAPARDAQELARVLGDPEVGGFKVDVSLNEPDHVVRRKLSEFFRDRSRDDLLLLHVSCHGLKDEDGTLYFASANTEVRHLEATAIPSEFVNRQMTKSRSRRIVLLLDCCFGGAFARGMVHRAGENVAIKEEFEGQGRVVLTASRAMEYAFEGDNREGDARPSIFTSAIVQGLESGEADRDRDSRVSVDELYDYVYDRVRDATPNQTPSKWTFDVHGDLYLARSPFRAPEAVALPAELTAAMESPFAHVRAGAVEELAGLSAGTDLGLALSARMALEQLLEDDSKRVSDAAARGLVQEAGAPPPAPVLAASAPAEVAREDRPAAVQSPPEPSPSTGSMLARALAGAASKQTTLALGGALLFMIAYFQSASWDTAWYFAAKFDEIWALWSPLEAYGAALLVAFALLARRRGRLAREAADGLLLGVGLVAIIAMAAFVGSVFESEGTDCLTVFGAAAIAAAGALGLLTRRAPEVALSRRWQLIIAVGIVLALSPLVVKMGFWDNSHLLGDWGGAFAGEVLFAGVLAVVALLVLTRSPRARLPAGGVLIGVGAMVALHLIGLMIQIAADNDGAALRLGGPLGLAGGLLLVAVGISVVRADPNRAGPPA